MSVRKTVRTREYLKNGDVLVDKIRLLEEPVSGDFMVFM